MRWQSRLSRLEQKIRLDRGCPGCRPRRGQTALVESQRLADGTTQRLGAWPEPCAVCGTTPEMIVEVIRPLPSEAASEAEGRVRAMQTPGERP